MTVDELIEQLQEIKQLHPMAGRCEVIRISKKRKYAKALWDVNYKIYPRFKSIYTVRLEFE